MSRFLSSCYSSACFEPDVGNLFPWSSFLPLPTLRLPVLIFVFALLLPFTLFLVLSRCLFPFAPRSLLPPALLVRHFRRLHNSKHRIVSSMVSVWLWVLISLVFALQLLSSHCVSSPSITHYNLLFLALFDFVSLVPRMYWVRLRSYWSEDLDPYQTLPNNKRPFVSSIFNAAHLVQISGSYHITIWALYFQIALPSLWALFSTHSHSVSLAFHIQDVWKHDLTQVITKWLSPPTFQSCSQSKPRSLLLLNRCLTQHTQ